MNASNRIVAGRPATAKTACRICHAGHSGATISVPEMMFGTREQFDYFACAACGTLQVAELPADLSRYYGGSTYYSFNRTANQTRTRRIVKSLIAGQMVGRPERYPTGSTVMDRLRRGAEPWIATVPGLTRRSRILDVGSGEGARLRALAEMGFTNLTGVDPFLPYEQAGRREGGFHLVQAHLGDLDGRYDLVMMHHSLEHAPDPASLLCDAAGRLADAGKILVRIPILQDAIWQEYGVNWSQIDAPRHLHLFTMQGFIDFSACLGLSCVARGCDGQGWSLAWSEAYRRGVPMARTDGRKNDLPLSRAELDACDRRAACLNAAGQGDQAYFVLEAA